MKQLPLFPELQLETITSVDLGAEPGVPFIAPVLNEDGSDTGLVCVFDPVSGPRRRAKRLAAAKAKYGVKP